MYVVEFEILARPRGWEKNCLKYQTLASLIKSILKLKEKTVEHIGLA